MTSGTTRRAVVGGGGVDIQDGLLGFVAGQGIFTVLTHSLLLAVADGVDLNTCFNLAQSTQY